MYRMFEYMYSIFFDSPNRSVLHLNSFLKIKSEWWVMVLLERLLLLLVFVLCRGCFSFCFVVECTKLLSYFRNWRIYFYNWVSFSFRFHVLMEWLLGEVRRFYLYWLTAIWVHGQLLSSCIVSSECHRFFSDLSVNIYSNNNLFNFFEDDSTFEVFSFKVHFWRKHYFYFWIAHALRSFWTFTAGLFFSSSDKILFCK